MLIATFLHFSTNPFGRTKMPPTKISTSVVELNNDEFVMCKRVPNCFNFVITQPTPDTVMAGCLDKKPLFGGSAPRWRYRHIDCQIGQTLTSFEYNSAVSTKDFRDKWRTQYFYDGNSGFAIIGEESTNSFYQENEPKQTVIYYEVNVSTVLVKGRIQFDEGILPNQIVVRYDREKCQLNLVVVATGIVVATGNILKWYGYSQDKIASGKPLSLSDYDYALETQVKHWLGPDSISPDGQTVLVYNRDCDYCQLIRLYNGEFDDMKWTAHKALFGEHTINWLAEPELRIIINCYLGQIVFDMADGQSKFVKHSIQTVSVRFANWKYKYSGDDTRTIQGLQWSMPNGVRAQPHRTFELEGILFKDDYDPSLGNTNKSIPHNKIGLDATLMFENDFVAIFLIGARTIIGFDKFIQHSPVVYQLSEKFKDYTICAITQDRITAYFMEEDDYEEYGYYGDFNVLNFPYQFARRITSLSRFAKVPEIPFGASRAISGFLSQQKKD